jgi:copper oxidase (laccase) domain-containing protein
MVFQKNLDEVTFEVWDECPNHLNIFTVNQIHSNFFSNTADNKANIDADGIISFDREIILAIKTADCVPIAIKGKKGIALIHAGWKGLQSQILSQEQVKDLEPQFAYIGPHIRVKNYEVGEKFKENFPTSTHFEEIDGKICFNMLNTVIDQLSSNYPGIIIEDCKLDTFEEANLRSYRNGDFKKRNWNILKYT